MSEILTIDLKELETKVENGKGFNHKEATVLLEFVRKIISNGGTVQPQLTIPKSAADILDKVFNDFEELKNSANSLMIRAIYEHYYPEDPFYKWCYRENDSYNISIIHLAGKALGVDLVRVTED